MSRWFRMYNEALDDPKVQSLPAADFKGWVNILLLACRHDGILPPIDDVAFALRLSLSQAKALLKRLDSQALIDRSDTDDSCGSPHGWNNRQYKSDVSTDRVKRFRNGKGNVSSDVSVTAPEAETESETEITPAKGETFVVGEARGHVREAGPFSLIAGGAK